jgi:hypothetical protein
MLSCIICACYFGLTLWFMLSVFCEKLTWLNKKAIYLLDDQTHICSAVFFLHTGGNE